MSFDGLKYRGAVFACQGIFGIPTAFFWHDDRSGSFRRYSQGFGLYLLSKVLPWMLYHRNLAAYKNISISNVHKKQNQSNVSCFLGKSTAGAACRKTFSVLPKSSIRTI